MRKMLIVGLASLGLLSPMMASAQEAGFSNEQIMLNNQAVEATKAGNYFKAEQLFSAILQIGEFNVVWLNLGRAYASQDKCIEASEAFSHVKTAPVTSEIPVEIVNAKLAEYLVELEEKCSAHVIFDCIPAKMQIAIDDSKAFECTPEPVSLTPGQHKVNARTDFGINSITFDAQAGGPQTVKVEVVNFEQMAIDAALTPEVRARKSMIYKTVGYSFIGVGAAAGIGGGLLMYLSHDKYQKDSANSKITLPGESEAICNRDCINASRLNNEKNIKVSYGLIAAGGVFLAVGVALVIVDVVKFSDDSKGTASFEFTPTPIFSPEFKGLGIVGRF